MELFKNVRTSQQCRRHFDIDMGRFNRLERLLHCGRRPSVKEMRGILRVVATKDITVPADKGAYYFRHMVTDGSICRFMVRGQLTHTQHGWVATTNTVEMSVGTTRFQHVIYDVYGPDDVDIITPRQVLQSVMADPQPHFGHRTVEQRAVSGEFFLRELLWNVIDAPEHLSRSERLRFVEEATLGYTMLASTLDNLGLEGTPLAFHDPVELGHGNPEDLLAKHFPDMKVIEDWRCISSRSDHLQWHGGRVTPYTTRDAGHKNRLISTLSELVSIVLHK